MNLQRTILNVLIDLESRLTPTGVVHAQLGLSTGKYETLGDVTACLQALERKGQVQGIDHEDYGHRWKITDEGKARLRE